MPAKKSRSSGMIQNPSLLQALLSKYRNDPDGFRGYLPKVSNMLDAMFPPRVMGRSPFGLTEHERTQRQVALAQVLEGLKEEKTSQEEAVRGLEHCATLIEDDGLPEEVAYETLVKLVRAAIGKSPGSFKKNSTVLIHPDREMREVPVKHVSLVRGVVLNLTGERELVSITIAPRGIQERRKALRFVGIASDSRTDVARRHDDYLADSNPHASA